MNRKDFIDIIANNTGLKKVDVMKVVDEGMNIILTYAPKEDIKLFPLGTFKFKIKAARKCPNPQTGGTIEIPERKTIEFKLFKDGLIVLNEHTKTVDLE